MVKNGVMAVSEGANMPTDPDAVNIFRDNRILHAPGKASNAGGVAVSGLEMSQNSMRLSWTREEVDRRLQGIMQRIHEQCATYGAEGELHQLLQRRQYRRIQEGGRFHARSRTGLSVSFL